jgi:hypothetical protein
MLSDWYTVPRRVSSYAKVRIDGETRYGACTAVSPGVGCGGCSGQCVGPHRERDRRNVRVAEIADQGVHSAGV